MYCETKRQFRAQTIGRSPDPQVSTGGKEHLVVNISKARRMEREEGDV